MLLIKFNNPIRIIGAAYFFYNDIIRYANEVLTKKEFFLKKHGDITATPYCYFKHI